MSSEELKQAIRRQPERVAGFRSRIPAPCSQGLQPPTGCMAMAAACGCGAGLVLVVISDLFVIIKSGLILPDWGEVLRNYYWQLRYLRPYDQAARRKYYRRIEAEKKRLHMAGVDQEAVRLFCRWMANPRNEFAERRFRFYTMQARLF